MFILITGGSGSGKSAFAENKTIEISDSSRLKDRIYLATMMVYGKEEEEKVLRHQKLRAGKGFKTIECQKNIGVLWQKGVSENGIHIDRNSIVLLECMTNLLANEMFSKDTPVSGNMVAENIIRDIRNLNEKAGSLVIITGDIFSDGISYDEASEDYIRTLAFINKELVTFADEAYEVVAGIPLKIK